MIYNFWLKIYDSLFGPDKPCPAGGEPQPESQPEAEPQPQPETPPQPQPEATRVEIPNPVPKEVPLNEQPVAPVVTPQPLEQPVAPTESTQPLEQSKTGFNGGGRRKEDLLRKIKNLTRSLKRRS